MLSLRGWLLALLPVRESALQCHIDFSLMRSAVLCLRGSRSLLGHLPDPSMIDLAVHEGHLQP